MNLLFPVLLYMGVFLGQSEFAPPTVGFVLPGHAAAGKLQRGDRVLSVNDERITTFAELKRWVKLNPGRKLKLKLLRDNAHAEVTVTPDERVVRKPLGIVDRVGSIGVGPHRPAAVVGVTDRQSAAFRAGLRTFDRVTEVSGKAVGSLAELEEVIAQNRGETVPVTYLRPVHVQAAFGSLGDFFVYESGLAALTPETSGRDMLERTGMESVDLYVARVAADSPAWRAGLRAGDRLAQIDQIELSGWSMFHERFLAMPLKRHEITWLRDGRSQTANITPASHMTRDEAGAPVRRPAIAIHHWRPHMPTRYEGRPSLINYVLPSAVEETFEGIHFISVGLWRIACGDLNLSTLGGPITVYDVVMQERAKGPGYLLWAMAVISLNLGLINLLPIPVLDGGHLVFFAAEATIRRPLPLRVREFASLIGFVMLVVLVGIALRNDVVRRWDVIRVQTEAVFG
jgi:regulator of sigma E protease